MAEHGNPQTIRTDPATIFGSNRYNISQRRQLSPNDILGTVNSSHAVLNERSHNNRQTRTNQQGRAIRQMRRVATRERAGKSNSQSEISNNNSVRCSIHAYGVLWCSVPQLREPCRCENTGQEIGPGSTRTHPREVNTKHDETPRASKL